MPLPKRISVKIETLRVDSIEPAPYNAHVATQEALDGLAASLEKFGVLMLPCVNKRPDGKYRLIGGHKRIGVLKKKGTDEIQCIVVEFDDDTERRANVTLNNREIQGDFIPELTRKLLDSLKTRIPSTAFTALRLDKLVKSATRSITHVAGVDDVQTGGKGDDDEEVKLARTTPESKTGTFYALGDHVIFCGKMESRRTLSGFPVTGADIAFASLRSKNKINVDFIDAHLSFILSHVDGAVYIATDNTALPTVQSRLVALGGHWSNTLVWFNPDAKPNEEIYRDVTIPVLYGWRKDSPHYFGGPNDQGNIFKLTRAPKSEMPVEVITKAIINSSKAGQTILDPDAGRGAVVIAAQKTNRKVIGFCNTTRDMDAVRIRWARFIHGDKVNWQAETPEFKK